MKKHTKETYFKIVGYPEWWKDSKQKNRKAATAAVTHGGDKEKRIPAQENLISGFFIVGQLTP